MDEIKSPHAKVSIGENVVAIVRNNKTGKIKKKVESKISE